MKNPVFIIKNMDVLDLNHEITRVQDQVLLRNMINPIQGPIPEGVQDLDRIIMNESKIAIKSCILIQVIINSTIAMADMKVLIQKREEVLRVLNHLDMKKYVEGMISLEICQITVLDLNHLITEMFM